jgi:CDP-4-dehydro-6-deoxyglucose reductase, E1
MNLEEIKQDIFKNVKKYYEQQHSEKEFVPGKSKIDYAGRVFDYKEITNLIDSALEFWLTSGRYAAKFEKEFAEFLGLKFCSLTNSGSSANLLALSSLTSHKLGTRKVIPGDEVITTACGFPTTLNPIIQNNLFPVFIDIEIGSYNIKADDIESAITEKTKVIFIPHTLGNPANLNKILKVVKKYKLWFIEDNCDALGSKYAGKNTGGFGHISTFSFYPAHHITMGEGGALCTNDPELRDIINSFRDWGRDCWCEPGHDNTCGKRFSQKFSELPFGYDHKYVYSHIGYNLKLTDMQAAIGVEQLKKLPAFIEKRKHNFKFLYNNLKKYEKYFILPNWENESDVSWFGFPIFVKNNAPFTRDEVVNFLENSKVATRMLFGGNLIKQPAYENIKYRINNDLSNTDLVMKNLFWIGVYPGIGMDELNYMFKIFDNFFKRI